MLKSKIDCRPVTPADEKNATVRRALLGHLVKVATLHQRDEAHSEYRSPEIYRGYIADHEIRNILDALQAFK
jgi:hypothetical protein